MKQRRPVPWKGLLVCTIAGFLIVCFFIEYFQIALFFCVPFALGLLRLGYVLWRDRRKARRQEEDQEEAASRLREQRRKICQETRYLPEERAAVEAYLVESLGPISCWDRQEGNGAPDVDIAFIPPTETVSYWRAVTVGAGAVNMEGGRTELALLLPPDQDPAEGWASRVLREAVQNCLLFGGGIRPGASLRGFHLTGAGFARAMAVECAQGLPGFPELASLTLPAGDTLWFCWLLPLLKPEWDYCQERGLASLFRRMSGKDPAADPRREPWAGWDWFREDIAPFAWSESGGRFCLGLDTRDFRRDLFLRAGLTGTGWDWERLAREYLRRFQPDDGPFVEYACEESVFFAASEDEEIMRRLALGLSDLLRYRPDLVLTLLVPDERIRKGDFS